MFRPSQLDENVGGTGPLIFRGNFPGRTADLRITIYSPPTFLVLHLSGPPVFCWKKCDDSHEPSINLHIFFFFGILALALSFCLWALATT